MTFQSPSPPKNCSNSSSRPSFTLNCHMIATISILTQIGGAPRSYVEDDVESRGGCQADFGDGFSSRKPRGGRDRRRDCACPCEATGSVNTTPPLPTLPPP